MPETFDRDKFLKANQERNEEFAKAKKASDPFWKPPQGVYVAELTEVRLDVKEEDGETVRVLKPRWTVMDVERLDEEYNGKLQKRFFWDYWTDKPSRLGVLGRFIASMYGKNPVPDDLGEAMLGVKEMEGKCFRVRVAENPNNGMKNVYVNGPVEVASA